MRRAAQVRQFIQPKTFAITTSRFLSNLSAPARAQDAAKKPQALKPQSSSCSCDEFTHRQFPGGKAGGLSLNRNVFGFGATPVALATAFDRDKVVLAETVMDPHSFDVHLKLPLSFLRPR
jgi:hypothetical protein